MPVDKLLLLIPGLFAVLGPLRRRGGLALYLTLSWVYPLLVLASVDDREFSFPGLYVMPAICNRLRLAIISINFVVLFILALSRGGIRIVDRSVALWVHLSIVAMVLSISANTLLGHTSLETLYRLPIVLVHIWNGFVLLPSCIAGKERTFLRELTIRLSWLALGFLVLNMLGVLLYGTRAVWSLKLARPTNPGALSWTLAAGCMLSSALGPSRASHFKMLLLSLGTVATGTRAAIIALSGFLANYAVRAKQQVFFVIVVIAALSYIGYMSTRPGLLLRRGNEFSSGRLDIWRQALDELRDPQVLLIGKGEIFKLESERVGMASHRLHNGLLEVLASYGILCVICVYAVYVVCIRRTYPRERDGDDADLERTMRSVWWMAVLWCFGSALETWLWYNMGDGKNILTLLVVVAGVQLQARIKAERAALSRVQRANVKS